MRLPKLADDSIGDGAPDGHDAPAGDDLRVVPDSFGQERPTVQHMRDTAPESSCAVFLCRVAMEYRRGQPHIHVCRKSLNNDSQSSPFALTDPDEVTRDVADSIGAIEAKQRR